ncbi:hypothetical protein [Devosia ginsengisoli]|uniref:hypothetical protein n=1 Tax=Devosia ginsengisoli TaxID=400770 RepID=UPI0026EBEAC2|nr:hypothetical protein [Devosia ginsengisoli]MCR6670025.1 hypothetical protein [Devosia ginsengisoli]
MANRPATIRKTDIERTVKGVLASGLAISRVEVEGGRLVIYTGDAVENETPLEAWRRANGAG